MTSYPDFHYIADAVVDATLDLELRALLSTCFTKPQDHVFKERRYFNEPPAHRWMIRDEAGALAAHLAVHDKRLFTDHGRVFRVGGVAEVCVHPAYQGRGYVKLLVAAVHAWMIAQGFVFSVLSGNPRYYASSGYLPVDNLFLDGKDADDGTPRRIKSVGALVVTLSTEPWPDGETHIPGPNF